MVTLTELNARLDVGLERRAWIHRLRKKGRIDVQNYKGGLKAVRDLEDELEPQRKALGAKHSRAIERVTVHSDGYYEPEGEVRMSDESNELDLGAPPEPSRDPFAEVPADAGAEPEAEAAAPAPADGTLGGDGGTLEELESGAEPINGGAEPEPGEFLEDPEAATAAEPEPEAAAAPEPQAEAKPQPASEDAQAEPKEGKKSGSSTRHYAVLMKNPDTGEWKDPFEEEGAIQAANGEIAMREAYSRLVPPDSEDQIELVVFPTHYWKPKKVGAKAKVKRSVTIE